MNDWIKFLKQHKGKGYTKKQLSIKYQNIKKAKICRGEVKKALETF